MATHQSYYHTTLITLITFTIIIIVQSFSSFPSITSFCQNKICHHHIGDTLRLKSQTKNLPPNNCCHESKNGYKHTHTFSLYSSSSPLSSPLTATSQPKNNPPSPPPPIPILFENDHLLAIDKPPHIPHHDDDTTPGILTLFRRQFPNQPRLYGVHRLDKITSGILLFAKSSHVAGLISQSFRTSRVRKYYVAVSAKNKPTKKMGRVEGFMARGRRGGWRLLSPEESKRRRRREEEGDWAESRFYTAGLGMLRPAATAATHPKTAVLLRPVTGKTHQLRVASKCVGLPILGDVTYGGGSGEERGYLHAMALHLDFDGDLDSVTIVSMPRFGELWEDEGEGFEVVVKGMMRKYCDCEELLEKMEEL